MAWGWDDLFDDPEEPEAELVMDFRENGWHVEIWYVDSYTDINDDPIKAYVFACFAKIRADGSSERSDITGKYHSYGNLTKWLSEKLGIENKSDELYETLEEMGF